MKKAVIFLGGVFVLAISFVIAKEMSADAMAVVVGIVCGIGASIPTSLLILMLINRKQDGHEPPRSYVGTPPVMIVTPPAGVYPPQYPPPGGQYLTPFNGGVPRQFQVLGGEDEGPSRPSW